MFGPFSAIQAFSSVLSDPLLCSQVFLSSGAATQIFLIFTAMLQSMSFSNHLENLGLCLLSELLQSSLLKAQQTFSLCLAEALYLSPAQHPTACPNEPVTPPDRQGGTGQGQSWPIAMNLRD